MRLLFLVRKTTYQVRNDGAPLPTADTPETLVPSLLVSSRRKFDSKRWLINWWSVASESQHLPGLNTQEHLLRKLHPIRVVGQKHASVQRSGLQLVVCSPHLSTGSATRNARFDSQCPPNSRRHAKLRANQPNSSRHHCQMSIALASNSFRTTRQTTRRTSKNGAPRGGWVHLLF